MNTRTLLVFLIAGWLRLSVLTSQGADGGHRFEPGDFPPSPFDVKLSTNASPRADQLLQALEKELARHAASTNPAAVDLMAEARELKARLLSLREAVEAKDPLLRVYGQYVETAHDWVMKTHGREFWEANRYFSSKLAQPAKRRTQDNLVALIDMALFKQLASNTNFAPLLKSLYGARERNLPGRLAASYARNDALLGFHPKTPAGAATTFEAYVDELERRYDLVQAKLEELARAEEIPADVVLGWMYGDLYRMLDGAAQQYVELQTPDGLKTLQEQLRQKVTQLSHLAAPGQ